MAVKKSRFKEPAKRHSSSEVGRAGIAATPEQRAEKAAKKSVTKQVYGDKRDPRKEVAVIPFDRGAVDVLIVQQTDEMRQHGENDLHAAKKAGFEPVPEMSDPEVGVTFMVRDKRVRLKNDKDRMDRCARLIVASAQDGVGIKDEATIKVTQNISTYAGRVLPTNAGVGAKSGLDALIDGPEGT